MDCLDDATALSFARGELDPDALDPAIEHIARCEACRLLVAAAAATSLPPTKSGGSPRSEATLPSQIGRFEIEGIAGRGAMGVVYRGYDERLDRPVALKLIHPELLGSGARIRLAREARALAKVDHPAVVGVYEVGDFEGSLFVAMEFVEGGTLEDWLSASPREPAEILARFIQAGEGLHAAHQAGLVHRDFKPANAMLDGRGNVHVTDFGLVSEGQSEPNAARSIAPLTQLALTQTGALVGTPAYMAPEQLHAKPADPRSDQFSFCVALFEALAGHRPHEARTYAELSAALLSGRPALPRRPIQKRVHKALLRGLALDPRDRFASMRELLDELALPRARPGLRWLVGLASVGVLAAAGFAWTEIARDEAVDESPTLEPDVAELPTAPTTERPTEPTAALGPTSPCTELSERWATVWTDERKQALRSSVTATWPESPPEHAKAQIRDNWAGLGRVKGTLAIDLVRRYGDTWRSLVAETCIDPDKQDTSSNQLRRACLDDALSQVEAMIVEPPTGSFQDAFEPIKAQLQRCSTHMVESLTLPRAEAIALVDEARDKLARASSARGQDRIVEALVLGADAIALGEQAGDAPVLAEAWLTQGRTLSLTDRQDEATSALHQSVAFAQEAMHHRILREASEDLAWQYLFGDDDPLQAQRWLDASERLDARVTPNEYELTRRAFMRAHLALRRDDPEAAIELLRGMLDHDLGPALARGVLTTWMAALDANDVDEPAKRALLDDFAQRYSLEPSLLEKVEALRASLD